MPLGVILFFILVGGTYIFGYITSRQKNRVIETWPKSKGTILNTKLLRSRKTGHWLFVTYEFYIDGKRYQSNYVYLKNRYYGVNPNKLDKLEFLQNPEVRYDPMKPDNCCLVPFPNGWVAHFLITAGIIFSLFGWLGLLFRFLDRV